jgi:hypothetical protein
MDFHGSYRRVVQNLNDALRLHRKDFSNILQQKPEWLSEKIEGPNIANVFKRTFYQIMLKFQIGAQGSCVGSALGLPRSVWDSWQRHLGAPELTAGADGVYSLRRPDAPSHRIPAWIYVFDVNATSKSNPNSNRRVDDNRNRRCFGRTLRPGYNSAYDGGGIRSHRQNSFDNPAQARHMVAGNQRVTASAAGGGALAIGGGVTRR